MASQSEFHTRRQLRKKGFGGRKGRPSVASRASVTARERVTWEVARMAEQFPDLGLPELSIDRLAPADARLATAVHRLVLQRWQTLEFLIDRFLARQSLGRLEPMLQAVLLTGAAQLVFMDRLPAYAVVDEMVSIARRFIRPGAGNLVNAVLRRLSELVVHADLLPGWEPRADRLPDGAGGQLALAEPFLPQPQGRWLEHVAVACSLPLNLLKHWQERWGREEVQRLARHATLRPPTLIVLEEGRSADTVPGLLPHAVAGVGVWEAGGSDLRSLLEEHPDRRVQDPTAAAAVQAAAAERAEWILDFCAGLGTKTRQLQRAFPGASVVASDVNESRYQILAAEAKGRPGLNVCRSGEALAAGPFDLLVLDVPCSNLGVLARRPGARYRYGRQSIRALVDLQRSIMQEALPAVAPGGRVLYSTCSIDEAENEAQAAFLAQRWGAQLLEERLTLPGGEGATYHDGGYFALLRMPAATGT